MERGFLLVHCSTEDAAHHGGEGMVSIAQACLSLSLAQVRKQRARSGSGLACKTSHPPLLPRWHALSGKMPPHTAPSNCDLHLGPCVI